jgi:hypothetical protein
VVIGVMSNVVMMNFCYDVPVKLYSSHLLLMACFIVAPDAKRLLALIPPVPPAPRWTIAVRTAAVVLFVAWSIHDVDKLLHTIPPPESAPLYGIWNVEEMKIDGVVHPPLLTDGSRWRRVVFDSTRLMSIHNLDDTIVRYMYKDTGRALTMKNPKSGDVNLAYERPQPDTLLVNAMIKGRRLDATLHKDTKHKFLLTTRGFHWINEYPLNR